MKKLHVCCGDVYLKGYVNVDIKGTPVEDVADNPNLTTLSRYFKYPFGSPRREVIIDKRMDVMEPWDFEDSSIDEIVMISSIEHFTRKQAEFIISEVKRILKFNGVFVFDFPDIKKDLEQYYENNTDFLMTLIYCNQKDKYSAHRWGYTKETIKGLLGEGWKDIEFKEVVKHDYPMIPVCAIRGRNEPIVMEENDVLDDQIAFYWQPRSGGTFIWQVLKEIFKGSNISTAHGVELVDTDLPLVVAYRDFRDTAVSLWRILNGEYDKNGNLVNLPSTPGDIRCMVDGSLKNVKILDKYKMTRKHNDTLWLRYEDFFSNYTSLFRSLEKFLDIRLSEGKREKIKGNTNLNANIQRSRDIQEGKLDFVETPNFSGSVNDFYKFNKESKIHAIHIHTGKVNGWKEMVPRKFHHLLCDKMRPKLEEWGYEVEKELEYYGQHKEDKLIKKYLSIDPNETNGKYIDIGTGEPIKINNSYYFYERGWRGILIEPHPRYYQLIKEERPEDIFLNIAITDYDGEIEMCDTATTGCPRR